MLVTLLVYQKKFYLEKVVDSDFTVDSLKLRARRRVVVEETEYDLDVVRDLKVGVVDRVESLCISFSCQKVGISREDRHNIQ